MKSLSAGLTFVNVAVASALLLGIVLHGLGSGVAAVLAIFRVIAAVFA